ncbi:MAG: zinc ribbon domain-containing protein [Candidatus Krumholzibacteriia bacterium]
MPIFEFECQQCRHTFEDLMTYAALEAGEAVCPACGSQKVQRALSSFATGQAGATASGGCGAPGGGCGSGFS